MSIEIILNGKTHRLDEQQSVSDLVATLNLSHQAIAVAVNRSIIARADWDEYKLQAQDHVDLVHAIGGG